MSAHTPGPWTAVLSQFPISITHGPDGLVVADVPTDDDADGEARVKADEATIADAKLIAAAPDLLEALRDIVNASGQRFEGPMMVAARAALAKASV